MRKLWIALLVVALALSGIVGTSAGFTNRVTSSGSSITAATLVAPALATPVVSGKGKKGQVALSWTAPTFATSWIVYRSNGTCASHSWAQVGTVPVLSYTDTPGSKGTYCYAI